MALVTAVPLEAATLLRSLIQSRKSADGITTGRLYGVRIAHACSGPGMAGAAATAAMLMERYAPGAIVSLGVGGAFPGTGLGTGWSCRRISRR